MTDYIRLGGIRAYGYTGFLAEEQTLGQWFIVDLELTVDLTTAGTNDNLADSVDYRSVIACTQTLIKTQIFKTLERMATAIAEALFQLETAERLQQVRVQLHKPAAPIPDFDGQITIDITRQR